MISRFFAICRKGGKCAAEEGRGRDAIKLDESQQHIL